MNTLAIIMPMYKDGKKKIELDPMNFICYVNGTDYLKEVRKALGK